LEKNVQTSTIELPLEKIKQMVVGLPQEAQKASWWREENVTWSKFWTEVGYEVFDFRKIGTENIVYFRKESLRSYLIRRFWHYFELSDEIFSPIPTFFKRLKKHSLFASGVLVLAAVVFILPILLLFLKPSEYRGGNNIPRHSPVVNGNDARGETITYSELRGMFGGMHGDLARMHDATIERYDRIRVMYDHIRDRESMARDRDFNSEAVSASGHTALMFAVLANR